MKVALIWSSPNTDGLTAKAKDQLMAGLKAGGAEIDEIHLNVCQLEHCRACGNGWGLCSVQGSCVLQDDFADLYHRLQAADGMVLVSAVYWHDTTEAFKAFFDRLRRCETSHNHFLKDKTVLLTACAGGTGNGAIQCLHIMEETIRHMGMKACDRLPVIQHNRSYMLPALEVAGKVYAERLQENFK